jgi:FkbM family methyltransferase
VWKAAGPREAIAFAWARLTRSEKVRSIDIDGCTLRIRAGTTDIKVAINSLIEKEYAHIRLDRPTVIVDAGANIGTSAIYFARAFPQARIFAIEPEAGNFELLVQNVAPYPNVVPVKAALWGADETRSIQNRMTGPWGFTVSDTKGAAAPTGQEIPCVSMSTLMQRYAIGRVDLLKMDIEGGEKDVLENSAAWIAAVDVMTVELHDRINLGCSRAFYLATRDFKRFEKHGEKVTAYRVGE